MSNLADLPRGKTCRGVYRAALTYFLKQFDTRDPLAILDAPAGRGDFLLAFRKQFPNAKMVGIDLFTEPHPEAAEMIHRVDVHAGLEDLAEGPFDLVTCISGVMCFDGISQVISQFKEQLKPGGRLLLSNDNEATMADRLSYLFLGRTHTFRLACNHNESNWNQMNIQALWMLLAQNGFEIEHVEYTHIRVLDRWLYTLPAALLYPLQRRALMAGKGTMPKEDRRRLFPFISLLARHYILVARRI